MLLYSIYIVSKPYLMLCMRTALINHMLHWSLFFLYCSQFLKKTKQSCWLTHTIHWVSHQHTHCCSPVKTGSTIHFRWCLSMKTTSCCFLVWRAALREDLWYISTVQTDYMPHCINHVCIAHNLIKWGSELFLDRAKSMPSSFYKATCRRKFSIPVNQKHKT